MDTTKTLPKLPQYPLWSETIQGLTPTGEDLISQELITPYTKPDNTQILSVWKPTGEGWRFVQDWRPMNKIVFSLFYSCSKPKHTCAPSSTRLSTVHGCGPLFSFLQHPCRPQQPISICLYLEWSKLYLDSHASRAHWGLFLFLPSTPPRFNHPPVPWEISHVTIRRWPLVCSDLEEASIKSSIYLLQSLVEKGHKVS